MKSFLIGLVLCGLATTSFASDLAKEKRWANQVVDAIMDGDAVWLNDGKNDFLSIYTEAAEESNRAAIIMHGTGVHPNWQQVIQPLRVGLTQHGWNTLSIQMPILANDAEHESYAPLYDEIGPRVKAAIDYLNKQGKTDIVLIGHSQGGTMASYYLRSNPGHVSAFVAVSMDSWPAKPKMDAAKSLEKISIPVLDVYGTDDLASVYEDLGRRAEAAKTGGNTNYRQVKLVGNHFFDGHEESLISAISDWLNSVQ